MSVDALTGQIQNELSGVLPLVVIRRNLDIVVGVV